MKLIIQSDDFGITEGVTYGTLKGIREGMITCTGLFANMPCSELAAQLIKAYPEVCLGQDINIVAGKPVSMPELVPHMIQENGYFLSSDMHRKIDEETENHDHLDYEECFTEVEAQIQRFIELVGKKPEYLHGHSYGTHTLGKAMHELSRKYQIPITFDMYEKYHIGFWKESWNKTPFDLEAQLNTNPIDYITNEKLQPKECEIALLGTHCGFVDYDLFQVSSYTLIRNQDLMAITSKQIKEWIQNEHIELISFRDLA